MTVLLDTILQTAKMSTDALVPVHVPEWGEGVTVYVFPDMTVRERDRVMSGINVSDTGAVWASYVLHCARDKEGSRIFDPMEAKHRAFIEGGRHMAVLGRIVAAGQMASDEELGNASETDATA